MGRARYAPGLHLRKKPVQGEETVVLRVQARRYGYEEGQEPAEGSPSLGADPWTRVLSRLEVSPHC
jgi:hypothetical protein